MLGVEFKSYAITAAAPRRKAKGDAAILSMRSGISRFCRPAFLLLMIERTSSRWASGFHCPWSSRGTLSRMLFPCSWRWATESRGLRILRRSFGDSFRLLAECRDIVDLVHQFAG